jgi:hypothetical protein
MTINLFQDTKSSIVMNAKISEVDVADQIFSLFVAEEDCLYFVELVYWSFRFSPVNENDIR